MSDAALRRSAPRGGRRAKTAPALSGPPVAALSHAARRTRPAAPRRCRTRRRHAKRRNRDQRRQRRIALERDRVHTSRGEQRAEVEVALRLGGAEEKGAAREGI